MEPSIIKPACLAAIAMSLLSGCSQDVSQEDDARVLESAAGSQALDNLLDRSAQSGEMSGDAFVTERMQNAASAYMRDLETARAEVAAADPRPTDVQFEDITARLDQIDAWVAVIDAGSSHRLTAEQDAQRGALARELSALQVELLPHLREQYTAPENSLEADAYCGTQGPGFAIALCVARDFRDQPRMIRFHNQIRTTLARLRFAETRYQPERHIPAHFYRYYLQPPDDGAVIVWNHDGSYRDTA